MAELKEANLKPRLFLKGLSTALALAMFCAVPTSTKAYIPIQPLVVQNGPSPRVKEEPKFIPIKEVKGYGTGYFGPLRKDYKTAEEYLAAIALQGKGDKTKSGTKPRAGITVAADKRFYPLGTFIFIPERNLMLTVEDTGSKVKGKEHVDIFCGHGKKAEKLAKEWGQGTPITLIIMKKV